jgi:hypothetical protein
LFSDLIYRKIRLRQATKEENNAQEHDEDSHTAHQGTQSSQAQCTTGTQFFSEFSDHANF